MASANKVTARTYPKRKRAEVSYHESSDSDESGVDDKYETLDDEPITTTRKKLKSSHVTTSSKPLPKRKIFPFMRLPAELRNQIYDLALVDPNHIFLVSKTKRYRRTVERSAPFSSRTPNYYYNRRWGSHHTQSQSSDVTPGSLLPALVPSLLLLNQAIYAEAQPILYAGNSFAVEDTTALHAFLATIGPKNRATISDLTIKGWGHTKAHKALNHPALTMLADAANLKRLILDCEIYYNNDPKSIAKQVYRDGFHWLEAVGAGKGKFDAAVDIIDIEAKHMTKKFYHPSDSRPTLDEAKEMFRSELRRLLS